LQRECFIADLFGEHVMIRQPGVWRDPYVGGLGSNGGGGAIAFVNFSTVQINVSGSNSGVLGSAHDAGRRWRKSRHGSIAEVQYVKDPHALVVPPRLHALRTHSNHARAQIIPADGPLCRDHIAVPLVQWAFCGRLK
jgi:hypothetical protein